MKICCTNKNYRLLTSTHWCYYNKTNIPSLFSVAVAPSISGLPALLTAHPGHTLESGHVIYNDKGSLGKLCLDNINETVTSENKTGVLFNVATSLCRTLNFK